MDDWELAYDEVAGTPGQDREAVLTAIAASGVTDLFVLAHGWNTDRDGATDLYDALVPLLRQAAAGAPGAVGTTGFLRLYWPSIWFPETPAVVPPERGDQQSDDGPSAAPDAGTAAVSGARISQSMRTGFTGDDADTVDEIGRLIDEGLAAAAAGAPEEDQRRRLDRLHDRLASLAERAATVAPEDSGELQLLFTDDPMTDYARLARTFGTASSCSSAQGIGDLFGTVFEGAKDALRVLSFTTMKARAGTVGSQGLGRELARLHRIAPELRVHLIGHSFGARLVAYATAGVGVVEESPISSLLLVQGAFSHFTFTRALDNPFGEAGALHEFGDRVHGLCAATFSVRDRALGVWYPRASFLSRDDQAAVGVDRWGAVGADGFQAVVPLTDRAFTEAGALDGPLPEDGYLRVDAAQVIREDQSAFAGAHSDIRHLPIAALAIAVAGAHAPSGVAPAG